MTTDPTDLRQRITDIATPFFANFSDEESARLNAGELADVLAAVLPPLADRATLQRAADTAYRIARQHDDRQLDERAQGAWDVENTLRAELRRMADEAQQQRPTTADKAAALGMTDTEYRAHSHATAVAAVRAAIPGMYAAVGFRLEDVLNEADEAQQPEPSVHGESVAHLAGLHDNEPAVDARQDGAQQCPAKHGALGRICELAPGHPGMHTGSGANGSAVWDGDAP